jgi:uncharacterized protein YdaU (DUF1376 family)
MSRPWMPLYVGDYISDTGHLTATQHGAYLLLMMHYWQKKGLPNDDRQLAAIARLTPAQWKKERDTIATFFQDGWKHKRIEFELTEADRISQAGRKGGVASGKARQAKTNDRSTTVQRLANDPPTIGEALPSPSQRKKDSEPTALAQAPIDHRKRLFDDGLQKLAIMTGKGPDACRSFVGKCLKASGDDAVTVLGLIEEAERNRVVDPSAWIAARLKQPDFTQGTANAKRTVHDAARDLTARLRALDEPSPAELRSGEGATPVRLLSSR